MLAALAAIGVLLPASRASAAKIDITPAISLDQVYDSNVFNTNGNEKGDFHPPRHARGHLLPQDARDDAEPADQPDLRHVLQVHRIEQHQFRDHPRSGFPAPHHAVPPVLHRSFRPFRPGPQLLSSDPTGAHGGPAGSPLDLRGIGHAEEPGLRGGPSGDLPPHGEIGILPRRGVQQAPVSRQHRGEHRFQSDQRRHDAYLQIHPALLLGTIFQYIVQHVRERDGFPGVRRGADGDL